MLPARTRYLLLLLQLLFLLTATAKTHTTAETSSTRQGHGGDERALVAFKAKISNHSGALASWNQSTSYCNWEGVTCSKRHQWRVVALDLSSQELDGIISPAIGNLTFLRSLNLSINTLQGKIPPSIGSLSRLQSLDLTQNMLTGVIPSNLSHCSSLRVMRIGTNKGLQGSIPDEFGNMPKLTKLILYETSITGSIPSSLGNLTFLHSLDLSLNTLQGEIPPSIGSLRCLVLIDLSGNMLTGVIPTGIGHNPHLSFFQLTGNNLTGSLPASLYNLSSLNVLAVGLNKLHGRLPSDLGKNLPNIQKIALIENRFTGTLPLSLTNLSSLQALSIGDNSFTGTIPSEIGRLQDLEEFSLDKNKFEAKNEQDWDFIPSLTNCSRLKVLTIGWNRLAGKLPSSLSNLSTNLQLLRTPFNNIYGVIPADIGNLASLEHLDFEYNLLTGVIPESIGRLTRLSYLILQANNFSGRVPSSIGNLTQSIMISTYSNSLEGPIPPSIGNLSKLLGLDLSYNMLTGLIPKEIMELPSISIIITLSNNMLEGPLPLKEGNLLNLEQLDLSGNKLSGEIPDTIGNCKLLEILFMNDNSFRGSIPTSVKNMAGLTFLNLTNNNLNGSIPASIASITGLRELDLAHNNLSGPIPEQLGNLTSLLHLDLSFNNLQGDVPETGVFRNLTGLSIVGNNALCGGIRQLHLPRCPNSTVRENKKRMPRSLRIAIPTIGGLLLLLLLAWAGFLYRKKKKAPQKDIPPQFTEIELPIVLYNDILKGTNEFSEENVLGKGRYGTVYKGTLENQAIDVAVKVFNLQLSGSYKSFQAECEALRRVKHRCLVKIITCCSSINHQGQDFRALVFEFMANGSLDRWIHSNFQGQNGQGVLSLSQRLNIAVDIVDALDYLHNGCQPPIIHCDLKPSNILLNQDMRARVGDFGIARVLDEAASKHPVNSSSTIGIRGSIGYIAPEYGEGLAVSTNGDVYSLGITLIEMFTGKGPTDDMFRDGISLHYYAEAALPDKVMGIADSNIWLHDEAKNKNDIRHITRSIECLSAIIQLGVLCSKQLPTERLSMSDAAAEMHAIRDKYIALNN